MNSPFAQIFLALQARIAEIIPDIGLIDMDYGQLESKERPAVAFPCVLVDFQNWQFEDLSNLVQTASGIIIVKLATDPYSGTDNITPDTYKQDALNIFELEYDLYKGLHGWNPGGNTGPLGRSYINTDNRRQGMKVRALSFSLSFQDYSAKRPQQIISAPANVTTQIIT
jgi:hypothetical protein